MVPPSTTLKPAGTPSAAEWASTFQCAVPRTCQMPFRSGLRSGVRGPLYAEAVWTAGARGGAAPRCACAIPIVSKARPVAAPMVMIGVFILTRESLPHAPAIRGTVGGRWSRRFLVADGSRASLQGGAVPLEGIANGEAGLEVGSCAGARAQ